MLCLKGIVKPLGKTGKIAIKVINHYGDEVLKVYIGVGLIVIVIIINIFQRRTAKGNLGYSALEDGVYKTQNPCFRYSPPLWIGD